MTFAQFGTLTKLLEAGATAVGAGILLGGFVSGVVGLFLMWPRRRFEARVLRDGYIGGLFGATMIVIDLIVRYGG